MTDANERFREADRLLELALDVPPRDRAAWLAKPCGDDEELKQLVEKLLELAEERDGRLETAGGWIGSVAEPIGRAELASGSRVGAYEIVGILGRGGMGRVYRARHPELDREVAVKALSSFLSGEASHPSRLRREAKLLASLNHLNIATIYDLVVVENEPSDLRALLSRLDSPRSSPLRPSVLAGAGMTALLLGALWMLPWKSLRDAPPAEVSAKPFLGVLYFDNLTRDPSLEWLRAGLPEMLVTDLSQRPGVRVLGTDRLHQILDEGNRLEERSTSFDTVRDVAGQAGLDTVVSTAPMP